MFTSPKVMLPFQIDRAIGPPGGRQRKMCAGEETRNTDDHGRTRAITDHPVRCPCRSVPVRVRPCSCEKLAGMRAGTTETRTWKVQGGHAEARADQPATPEPRATRLP